jgi:hypothetical protein
VPLSLFFLFSLLPTPYFLSSFPFAPLPLRLSAVASA